MVDKAHQVWTLARPASCSGHELCCNVLPNSLYKTWWYGTPQTPERRPMCGGGNCDCPTSALFQAPTRTAVPGKRERSSQALVECGVRRQTFSTSSGSLAPYHPALMKDLYSGICPAWQAKISGQCHAEHPCARPLPCHCCFIATGAQSQNLGPSTSRHALPGKPQRNSHVSCKGLQAVIQALAQLQGSFACSLTRGDIIRGPTQPSSDTPQSEHLDHKNAR